MSSSKKLIIKGVYWSGIQMVVSQSFAFLIRLVLAKILFPEEFGIVGMATVFIGFVQVLNDLGIAAALVQKKEDELRDDHFHTAFWTGVMWSVLLYLIMSLVVAPIAVNFYNQDILKVLIPVLSLGILSNPVNIVHNAILTKRMDFKKLAFINNFSSIVAGVIAVVLAYWGAGVWALAFNSVAMVLVSIPLYFNATKWKPKLIWNREAFRDVFGFGVFTTGTNVVNYLINNVDFLLIGKLLSAHYLGAYTFAFVLTDTFRSRLMKVINNVMYPIYGKNQTNYQSLKNYYLKVITYNSIIVFPIMTFMICLGEPFIVTFFGNKWSESIDVLSILALSVMVHMMVNSNTALIRGMGRPGLELTLQCIKAIIFIPILTFGILKYGILGAATAVLVNKIIAVVIAQYTFNHLLSIKLTFTDFIKSILLPFIASVISFIVAYVAYRIINIHFIFATVLLFSIYFSIIWFKMGAVLKSQFEQYKKGKNEKKDV